MSYKPSIPKGTRDFSPEEMLRRNYIFDTIRTVFRLYGFQQIETPAMENIETLMGKYGEEGDRLIFKVLNSGDFLAKAQSAFFSGNNSVEVSSEKIAPIISEKALRYDLTVPFARYVVMHRHEITFPFKRFQIQPVWRADRPQKGRYREFYQCDADVVGSDALLNEVEFVQMIDEVFSRLNIRHTIKINNRKILAGLAEILNEPLRVLDITVALDKLDKIGIDKVNEELRTKGIGETAIQKLNELIACFRVSENKLDILRSFLTDSESGRKGIQEVEYIFEALAGCALKTASCELDITLARGLNYYTGAIFEVKAGEGGLQSSICGGGRYDDLTGIFGLPGVSGVGISFGADRIYDVLSALDRFPAFADATAKVLFVNFGHREERYALGILQKVRAAGINAEIYPSAEKMKKQLEYADRKKIPYVVITGSEEMQHGQLTLKNMASGEQQQLTMELLLSQVAAG